MFLKGSFGRSKGLILILQYQIKSSWNVFLRKKNEKDGGAPAVGAHPFQSL